MADIVNLNRFRKNCRRAEKAWTAEENRARYGRTKSDKETAEKLEEGRKRHLDSHKKDVPDSGC